MPGVRGGLYNPSYWDSGISGLPEKLEPLWDLKLPSEGLHYP